MLKRAWEREILGRVLDHGMRGVEPLREELVGRARGRVLEVGFGTGANLPYYGDAVRELVAVEPSEGLADTARERLRAWGRPHELVIGSASRALPLDAGSFDAAVVTFVLCSADDPSALLAEVRRLLAPGAPLLIAEHVGGIGARAVAQRTIAPLWKLALGGCDPTRDVRAIAKRAGLDTANLEDRELALPWLVASGVVGSVS